MIHTKSLIRRLAYVPWLLAFGLVLGWAGEAQAQRYHTNCEIRVRRARGWWCEQDNGDSDQLNGTDGDHEIKTS